MDEIISKKAIKIFEQFSEIKLVYFFGSKAAGASGPLSDYDFAVYFSGIEEADFSDIRFQLYDKLSMLLRTDRLDIVPLNSVKSPELKYNIIKDGKLILEKEPFKVLVEPKILNEYFDFKACLKKYGLTRAV